MIFQIIKNYKLYSVTLTNGNQEYSQALSSNSVLIRFKAIGLNEVRYSFTELGSSAGYLVPIGAEWQSPGFIWGAKTIYLQSPSGGTVVQIEEWERA